jgi:hypothetical protein
MRTISTLTMLHCSILCQSFLKSIPIDIRLGGIQTISRRFTPSARQLQNLSNSSVDQQIASYWHMWTDETGRSRLSRRNLASSSLDVNSFLQGKEDTWTSRPQALGNGKVIFITLQPGKSLEWHENPQPQWIVPVKGSWFVETMDGLRAEMGPGDLSLGEDQNTTTFNGKKGHRSGALGDEPCVLMLVQFDKKIGDVTDAP